MFENENTEEVVETLEENKEAGSEENLEEGYGNSNASDRAGNPTSPVPTTKTGILSQLSDWGFSNEFVTRAGKLEYSELKDLIGKSTKETAASVFKDALGDAKNVTGVEQMNKDGSGLKEHIDAIFSGADLTEDFKTKATTVFEAAVNAAVTTAVKKIEEEAQTEIAARVAAIEEQLVDQVDKYMTYAAEQWLEENKLAVETGLKLELVEGFMVGLKQLFEAHHIDIPDDKINVVEELGEKVKELEESLKAQVDKNIALVTEANGLKKASVFAAVSEGLALSESEKLKTLVEKVEFESEEDYKAKITTIKESYFKKEATSLTEEKKPAAEKKEVVNPWAKALEGTPKR